MKGMTLIELLIVIIVIAIIAAIAIPALVNATPKEADNLAFSSQGSINENNKSYVLLQVWYKDGFYLAKISPEIIEVKVRGDGKDLTTISGKFSINPEGQWRSATIFVPNNEDKQIWDDFLKNLKSQTPQYPKRVLPSKP